jgi:hypothetical protein
MQCLIDNEVEYEGYFDSFENKLTTSLEAHVCGECGDTIHPGVEFWKAIGTYSIEDDNSEDIVKKDCVYETCQICEGLRRFLCDKVYGSLYEDINNGIMYADDPFEIENTILMSVNYTELQWLLRFDVLNLDNDLDNDED